MKKFLCAILFLTMVISLSACGGKGVSTLVKHYGQEKVDEMEIECTDETQLKVANDLIAEAKDKQMAFVNLSLFDNGTAFSDLPVLSCDFLLGAYPFACFVKEYASCGNLHIRLREQLPFTENQMNVVIGLALIVVQCRHTFHAVPPAELICKILKHLLRLVLRVNFGQGDNQLPCLNTFPLCAAALELLPALPCEIIPKGIVGGAVSGVQIFLSCVAGDIRYSSFDIRQLRHLYEAVSCHNPTFL